jgi:large subunit ribosomal protein L4
MKAQEDLLKVVNEIDLGEPKTKLMVGFLKTLRVEKTAVILLSHDIPNVQLAARNLPYVKVLRVDGVNTYDLLAYDYLICTQEALMDLQERVAS